MNFGLHSRRDLAMKIHRRVHFWDDAVLSVSYDQDWCHRVAAPDMFPTRTRGPLPILIEVRNLHMADEDSCCSCELV